MFTRRDFLKSSTLIALAPTVPGFLAQTVRGREVKRDGRVLVVLELGGGNDGINTVVPYKDDGYAKNRKALRLPTSQLIKVKDGLGLHPALVDAGKLLEKGLFSVVQGVGYPNPNRSHAESMNTWQTARLGPRPTDQGWIARALDGAATRGVTGPRGLWVGSGPPPRGLRGERPVADALRRPEELRLLPGADGRRVASDTELKGDLAAFVRRTALDSYTRIDEVARLTGMKETGVSYPATGLAQDLRTVARLLRAGAAARTRFFYIRQGGYDTHASQLGTHASLLGEVAGALKAFLDDLTACKLADQVAVMSFSEFGRTVKENASGGTDHGTAGPMFLAGPKVQAGLVGKAPSLLDLQNGDLKMSVDFRRVYATVLEKWLALPAKATLGGAFESLPLFRS